MNEERTGSFVTQIFHNGQPSHDGDRKTFSSIFLNLLLDSLSCSLKSISFPTNSEDDIVSFILLQSLLMEMLLIFSLVDVSLLVSSINVYLCSNY